MSRQKQERMQELVTLLNRAAKAYYQDAAGDYEQSGIRQVV